MYGSDYASRVIKKNREEGMARAQKRRDKTNMYSAIQKTELKFKEISEEELKKVKSRLSKKIRRDKNRIIITTIVLTIGILVAFYYYRLYSIYN